MLVICVYTKSDYKLQEIILLEEWEFAIPY